MIAFDKQQWHCPICGTCNYGKQPIKSFKTDNSSFIFLCCFCGYAMRACSEGIDDNLSNQKRFFDEDISRHSALEAKWPHRSALIAREVERLMGCAGKILDIGCNTGLNLKAFSNSWEKYGVELSSVAAAIAQQFTNANIYCGPIETYQIPDSFFDVIITFAVIEHVSDPVGLVHWCYEHIKPGGMIAIMTGDRESKVALEMGDTWPLYSPKEHLSFFSARSLCRLLSDTGFNIMRQEWRFMYTADGMGSVVFRRFQKFKEILRLITAPNFDHYYVYARKP